MSAAETPPTMRPLVLSAVLFCLALALPAAARAEPTPAPLGPVIAAWTAGSPEGVVASVPEKGVLTLRLLSPPVAASFLKAQAQQTLKSYFLKVRVVSLKDVTPRDHRDAPGFAVRTYDYTYRPLGRDPVVTRLEITLKVTAEGAWELVSVMERPRPEER